MVRSCAAYNCSRRWRKGGDISFHSFPLKNPERLIKWMTAIQRKDFFPMKSVHLCSKHFTPDDYIEQFDILPLTRRKLKDDAVPTIFDFSTHKKHSPKKTINRNSTLDSEEPGPSTAAGSSKRPIGNLGGDGEKKQKGRPTKKKKKIEYDEESEGDIPEDCLQDPLEIIEIEEPRIKQEVFETEEFSEIKIERVLPNEEVSQQEPTQFEAVYCTPAVIKEERQDYVETPSGAETVNFVPEFVQTGIKIEPLEVEDEEEDDEEISHGMEPKDLPPMMWRCPLVTCTEMFSAELEMYQHLNLNHVVKGLALSSKSKKVSGPRSVYVPPASVTKQLPGLPSVISPSTLPSVAISGSSGLVFITTASSPCVSPVTVTSVPTCLSVPSSSSGPVTVTTTFSYSSLTTSSAPIVTSVSSSSISSIDSAVLIPPISSDTVMTSRNPTPCLPVSSQLAVSTTSDHSSPNLNIPMTHSPNSVTATTGSKRPKKIIFAPISGQSSSSTGPKKFLLLAPHQPQQSSASKPPNQTTQPAKKLHKTQPLHIFQPSDHATEELPACATDDSERFSISLKWFAVDKRVPIKRKLLDVVDCIKQKNISPEKLLIAYYDKSSDSRTM